MGNQATLSLPVPIIRRLICADCARVERECDQHLGVDQAFEAGRAWAEREAAERGARPSEPWVGTVEEAIDLVDDRAPFRWDLAALANDAARDRWAEICSDG